MVVVIFPPTVRSVVKGRKIEVEYDGSLKNLLEELCSKYSGLKQILFEGEKLNRFINIYVNDKDVRLLDGLETKLNNEDVVKLIPAVAGG